MSEFFLAYRDHPKLQPMVAIIAWTHNLVIMQRCRDPLEHEFYIRMTRKFGWSKNVLIHQIENRFYEKTLLGQTNFDKALAPAQISNGQLRTAISPRRTRRARRKSSIMNHRSSIQKPPRNAEGHREEGWRTEGGGQRTD